MRSSVTYMQNIADMLYILLGVQHIFALGGNEGNNLSKWLSFVLKSH